MPSLYARVSSRGYASGVAAGQEGAAALESTQAIRRPASSPVDWGASPSTLTGFTAEGPPPPPPGVDILEGTWGLPGTLDDPYRSPGYGPGNVRTHAAPRPGWAGSYRPWNQEIAAEIDTLHENSRAIHAEDFGMPARLLRVLADGVAQQSADHWESNDPGGHTGQAPLAGPQRSMGYLSKDAIQGYDRANGYGFGAGHRWRDSYPGPHDAAGGQPMSYLDPAERPFIVPQAQGSFTPTDAVQGPEPWVSDLHAANLAYNDPTAYSPPPEPATLAAPLAEARAGSGWW